MKVALFCTNDVFQLMKRTEMVSNGRPETGDGKTETEIKILNASTLRLQKSLSIVRLIYVLNISFILIILIIFEMKISTIMNAINEIKRPSKAERKVARISYSALSAAVEHLKADRAEIEIEETRAKIIVPVRALKLLGEILKAMSQGKPISMVPMATEITTQSAAEILGCSRPYLVKLLEEGKIAYIKVGKHRRIKVEDVLQYKQEMKEDQKKHLIDMMNLDEELGLYDS